MATPLSLKWHPLELFDARFRVNLDALAKHDHDLAVQLAELAPSVPMFIAAEGDNVFLGRPGNAGMELLPNPLPPAKAREIVSDLAPQGFVSAPLVVGGLGYGWLWDRLAKLPCKVEAAPGHRPPIYLLAGDIERLWAVLHVLDWRDMLADARFRLFVGPDAAAQLRSALIENPALAWPRACVRVEPALWTKDFDSIMSEVAQDADRRLECLQNKLSEIYSQASDERLVRRFGSGKLRVLGITSRYTTFLQYSMRDWLAGFEQLGHETRLVIEGKDYEVNTGLTFASACAEFQPDLVVMIDHYRSEYKGLTDSVPFVMWVQDRLPNMFSARAGAAQGPRDYCLGFGRLHLARRFGYPAERFLPSVIGINEPKYADISLEDNEPAKYACDVSYVSHASASSQQLIEAEIARNPLPQTSRLLWDLHEQMVGHFCSGGQVLTDPVIRRHVMESMQRVGVSPDENVIQSLVGLFGQQVNNAIFRHQALEWVAQMGVDLRLWGRGWEKHPRLAKYARGPADNQHDLPLIYKSSKINLQLIPHGAVHQRLLDGLAAGAFFLIRDTPGDAIGVPYRRLWDWCRSNGISSDGQMRARADAQAMQLITEIDSLLGYDSSTHDLSLFDCIQTVADTDFLTLGSTAWPQEYPRVAFSSRDQLHSMLTRYLADDELRREIAGSMRRVVIERCSYRSISDRLLRFIAADLRRKSEDSPSHTNLAAMRPLRSGIVPEK